jgi:hypothetical protein
MKPKVTMRGPKALGERHKDVDWKLSTLQDGALEVEEVQIALLLDLRDELRKQNRLLTKFLAKSTPSRR